MFKQQLQHALSLWNGSICSLPLSLSPSLCVYLPHTISSTFCSLATNFQLHCIVIWNLLHRSTGPNSQQHTECNLNAISKCRRKRGEQQEGEVENSLSAKLYALSNYPRVLKHKFFTSFSSSRTGVRIGGCQIEASPKVLLHTHCTTSVETVNGKRGRGEEGQHRHNLWL